MRRKRAERAIGVQRARVPLLLGTISNWPQATIARGGRRAHTMRPRTHACRNGPRLGAEIQSEWWYPRLDTVMA